MRLAGLRRHLSQKSRPNTDRGESGCPLIHPHSACKHLTKKTSLSHRGPSIYCERPHLFNIARNSYTNLGSSHRLSWTAIMPYRPTSSSGNVLHIFSRPELMSPKTKWREGGCQNQAPTHPLSFTYYGLMYKSSVLVKLWSTAEEVPGKSKLQLIYLRKP